MSSSGSQGFARPTGTLPTSMESINVVIPAATGALQTITPSVNMTSLTAFNKSSSYVRGTLTFNGTATGEKTFVIGPNDTFSFSWDQTLFYSHPTVASIDYVAIATPTTTGHAATATPLTSLPTDALIVNNFMAG